MTNEDKAFRAPSREGVPSPTGFASKGADIKVCLPERHFRAIVAYQYFANYFQVRFSAEHYLNS
ncbi:MAG: hypothetical protein U5K31_07145 [Balneolaceae bacterium]|nr:hypothetical protein [Balneolaceae bacterium]